LILKMEAIYSSEVRHFYNYTALQHIRMYSSC
jgi:hypothetical protein